MRRSRIKTQYKHSRKRNKRYGMHASHVSNTHQVVAHFCAYMSQLLEQLRALPVSPSVAYVYMHDHIVYIRLYACMYCSVLLYDCVWIYMYVMASCICMIVCILYVHEYVCLCMCVFVYVCACVCVYVCVCVCLSMYVLVYVCVRVTCMNFIAMS